MKKALSIIFAIAILLMGSLSAVDVSADVFDGAIITVASGHYGDERPGLTYTVSDGQATITGHVRGGDDGYDIVIPAELDGYPVTSIGDEAFYMHPITSVIIQDGVMSIGEYAFQSCERLISIDIPNSVTSIGDGAFQSCTALTSIAIPDKMTTIGEWVFANSGLTSVTIPDGITNIGEGLFYDCRDLTSIIIPDSVTSIGEGAFISCDGLTSITIPNSVTSIEKDSFAFCTSLTSITIPDSVTSIGENAFMWCEGLTSVTLPSRIKNLDYAVFYGCTGLMSVTIPRSVQSIGNNAFYGCEHLTAVVFNNPETLIAEESEHKYIPGSIVGAVGYTKTYYPSFDNCPSLTTIYGFTGSTAEMFACDKGKIFIPIADVNLNGTPLAFDVPPQIIRDRTLVPMRQIFEEMGAAVDWAGDTQTITAVRDSIVITMQIGNPVMLANGEEIMLDVPPQIVMDRTLVPIRAVAEGLGANVAWDGENNTVEINM